MVLDSFLLIVNGASSVHISPDLDKIYTIFLFQLRNKLIYCTSWVHLAVNIQQILFLGKLFL